MSLVVFEAPIEEGILWLQVVGEKCNEWVEKDVPIELRASSVD